VLRSIIYDDDALEEDLLGEPAAEPEQPPKEPDGCSIEEFITAHQLFQPPPVYSVTGDPEGQVQRILLEVPDADPLYIREVVSRSTDAFIEVLLAPMSKRARFVRDAILRSGAVTALHIKQVYSNETMAVCDLAQTGVPLERRRERSPSGRTTTCYTLDPVEFQMRQEARACLSEKSRAALFERYGYMCAVCGHAHKRTLQADHRVPYRIVGNTRARMVGIDAFQALCPTCNTAKHWRCATCPTAESGDVDGPIGCQLCYWASPNNYTHIAGKPERRVVLVATRPEELQALTEVVRYAATLGLMVS
jgi:hypothetical protein